MRVVALDRIRDLIERREAVVHVFCHECTDAHAPLFFHPGRHIDEHQCPRDLFVRMLADRGEGCDTAERRAHQCRRRVERARDGEDVTRECIERVVAVNER